MNPATLPAIWMFIQVVEAGSLSGAAAVLNITPSGVSKQLSRLEKKLGVHLLHRTTRRLCPTAEGIAFYHRCRPLFEAFSEAEEEVRSMRVSLCGHLRVTATPAFGRALLVPAMRDFAIQHPAVSIELNFGTRREDLVEERIDLAVREGSLPDSSLVATKLMNTRIVLCAAPAYLDRKQPPETLSELSDHDIVSVPASGPASDPNRVDLPNQPALNLQPRFLVNDLYSLRDLALAGFGIATLPDFLINRELANGSLVQILPDVQRRHLAITALYPDRRFQPLRLRTLLNFLVDRFRTSPDVPVPRYPDLENPADKTASGH